MLKWIGENSITIKQAQEMPEDEKRGKFVTGKFVDVEKEDYSTRYKRLQRLAKEAAEGGRL